MVGAVILLVALLVSLVVILVQGRVTISLVPFAVLWGGLLVPTFLLWTSFVPSFVPVLGFVEGIGVDDDNRYEPRVYPDDFWVGRTGPLFGASAGFTTRITVTLPATYLANSVGVLVRDEVRNGRRTVEWRSDQMVRFFNVVAGRWNVRRGDRTAVFFHPDHAHNVDEMLAALDGARRYDSEWFYPYPWQELKLSEFADLARYAQGFPTNITFSEGIGFLTRDDRLGEGGQPNPDYRDARVTVTLAPGDEEELLIQCDFEPDRALPDPDVRVLQLNRAKALRRL